MPPSAELDSARTLLSDPGYTELDAVDRQLIELLQADGRIPYAELGRRADITEKAARRRVSRLLSEGYISIAAVTDPAVLGYGALAWRCSRWTARAPRSSSPLSWRCCPKPTT
ncbi:AsnC family transcriptional regulator [Mycolicibacterium fortuitum]|nr:AsnC family transcriptional regulator [Mycolicibacterium fortuitum]